MSGFNKCIFVGNLTKDAESRMVGETEVAKYSVTINGRKEKVTYIDCDHWRVGGVLPYLTKGTSVLVEGELEQQSWKDKEGNPKSKMVLQVRSLQLLGGKKVKEPEMDEDFASF